MSVRQQVFMTTGTMILVIFGMIFSYYTLSRANDSIDETQRLILEGREIGNKRGNATLGAVGEVIQHIETIQDHLLTNLTQHRVVANDTNERVQKLIIQFNQTNEQGRSAAVDQIIEAVNNNTKSLLEQYIKE